MILHPKNKFLTVPLFLLCAISAYAMQPEELTKVSDAPCAIVESSGGDVEILDSSRTTLIDPAKNVGVPCGGWISTQGGWAQIRHRDGYRVRFGADTFARVMAQDLPQDDQMILYRGQAYVQAGDGEKEFRMITANSRTRVSRGSILVLYNASSEESQTITIGGKATFENRFQPQRQIAVQAGEVSSLNFKLLRTVPTPAQLVSMASLRPKFLDLHFDDRETAFAMTSVKDREERKATAVATSGVDEPASRKPASDNDYTRHPTDPMSAVMHQRWVKKMVGGTESGEQILYPEQFHGRAQKVKLEIEDPAAKMQWQDDKKEQAEKRRLIEELSKIRDE